VAVVAVAVAAAIAEDGSDPSALLLPSSDAAARAGVSRLAASVPLGALAQGRPGRQRAGGRVRR